MVRCAVEHLYTLFDLLIKNVRQHQKGRWTSTLKYSKKQQITKNV